MDIMDGALVFLQVVLLDIALGGDNSIVIGMAAKGLPRELQKKVIFFGSAGAIIVRFLLAAVLVWLLAIPYLKTAGGLILIYIGMKLIGRKGQEENVHVKAKNTLMGAIQTVIVADAIMSLDNVLALVAATHGHLGLLITGMLLSVPVIILGSTIIVKIMDRFPWILYIGGLVIGWASGGMVATDPYMNLPPEYEIYIKTGMTALVGVGGWLWQCLARRKALGHTVA